MTLKELAALDPQPGDGWHVGDDHDSGETRTDMICDVCGIAEEFHDDECLTAVYAFSKLNRGFCADCLAKAYVIHRSSLMSGR